MMPAAQYCTRIGKRKVRHARGCRSREGSQCSCAPSYQAQVWSATEHKTIRRTFRSLGDARAWRHQSQVALRKGTLRSPSQTTLREAAEEWLAAAQVGLIRTRSGDAYKPSAVRAYRQALNYRVLPSLGSKRLIAISHTALQDLADQLCARGCPASRNLAGQVEPPKRRDLGRGWASAPDFVGLCIALAGPTNGTWSSSVIAKDKGCSEAPSRPS
jgi:hypothetical protein